MAMLTCMRVCMVSLKLSTLCGAGAAFLFACLPDWKLLALYLDMVAAGAGAGAGVHKCQLCTPNAGSQIGVVHLQWLASSWSILQYSQHLRHRGEIFSSAVALQ